MPHRDAELEQESSELQKANRKQRKNPAASTQEIDFDQRDLSEGEGDQEKKKRQRREGGSTAAESAEERAKQ